MILGWISLKRLNNFLTTEEPVPIDRECKKENLKIKNIKKNKNKNKKTNIRHWS